ncbi:hypothetical protein N8467_01170 [bacterium]|nr:hypothetical protein [bacterium]
MYIKSEKNIYAVLDTDSDNGSYFVVRGNGASSVFVIGEDGKVNQGSSDTPRNSYVLRHDATDGNNGMMIMNNSTSISTDNLLGGIGFDSNDGNEPSSILEASAYIAAYAAEAHSAFDKGGYLVLGVSQINDNDDTISTEILRMEQGSITTTVPIHISGSQTEGLRIGKPGNGYSEIQFETDGVDTAFIQVDSSEGMIIGCQSLNDEITFQTTDGNGTAERMRIAANGNVGIGTTDPKTVFDIHHDPTSLVANTGGGDVVKFGSGTLTTGKLYYLNGASWAEVDADAPATGADQLLGIAMGSSPTTDGLLVKGFFRAHTYLSNFSGGKAVYISTTAGGMNTTAPSGTGDFVRVVGYCTNANDVIYFNPSSTWIEL